MYVREELENIAKYNNLRCIISVEQEMIYKFKLTDRTKKIYLCVYCDKACEQNSIQN